MDLEKEKELETTSAQNLENERGSFRSSLSVKDIIESKSNGGSEDVEEEEEISLDYVKTPADLAPALVSLASKRATEVSSKVSSSSHFFGEYLSYLSSHKSGLPMPYVISHSQSIVGDFSFKYTDEKQIYNEIVKYTKEFFETKVKKFLGIPEESNVEVKIFGGNSYKEAVESARKSRIKNLVFPAYLAALRLEKDFLHQVLAEEFLGIEIGHSKSGDEYVVKMETPKNRRGVLPGFSFSLSVRLKATPYREHEETSYFFYPTQVLSPLNRVVFNLFFYSSLFDFLFGYSRESGTFSPIHHKIDKEYLHNLYLSTGRLENDKLVVSEIPRLIEEVSRLEESQGSSEDLELRLNKVISSGNYPAINSLSEFLKKIYVEYVLNLAKDKKRKLSNLNNKDVLDEAISALLLLLSLSEVESKIFQSKDLLESLINKSFSKITVGDLPYIFSRISEKVFHRKFANKPLFYINNQMKSLYNIVMAGEPRHRADYIARFFRYYTLDTIHYLKLSGVKELSFRFGESARTAFAARGRNSKGEDAYVLAFNPYFFVRNSIIHSIDLEILFSTILFHEFCHIRLKHLKDEISISGHEKFISEVPKELSWLVPKRMDNLHQDVYINNLSFRMSRYFAKSKFYSKSGVSLALDQERRIRSFLQNGFYFSESVEDYNLPQVYVSVNTSSGAEISGGVVSGDNQMYDKIRAYSIRYKIAIPDVLSSGNDVDEAIRKYLYKDYRLQLEGENLLELFSRRDQIGIGSILKIIAIIVQEAMS